MAYTTINKSKLHFNTKTYAGNGGSSTDSITGINFQPDWVWIKARNNAYNHNLYDVVRGLSSGAILSNTTAAQDSTQRISSFDSDGFTLPATNYTYVNASGTNYVAWNWKAGGSGSSNSDGSITSTVSANTTAGFSISKYTGTGSNATIGHGLGAAPKMIIIKNLTNTINWHCYHKSLGATKVIYLSLTNAAATDSTSFNDTEPTTSVFSVGTDTGTNQSGSDFIAYCFAEKKGYSKFGSYTGNGNADGTFVYTGFKPALIIFKRTDSTGFWRLVDNKRDVDNVAHHFLFANDSGAEATTVGSSQYDTDILSNGFKIRTTLASSNASGGTFIYMAFAEAPLVGSNNVPCTAR